MYVTEMQLVVSGHCVHVIVELHRHHQRHLCIICIILKGLGSGVWVLV